MSLKCYTKGSEFPPLEDGKLRLYSMRFCPFAQRTSLVLIHKEVEYETINVDLKNKPDWLLERNPLGLVPVLEHDGKIIYESTICNDYIDEIYPQKKLHPEDSYQKARDKILLEMFGKCIGPYYAVAKSKEPDQDLFDKFYKTQELFEKTIAERGDFFGGDQPSMLDFNMWPWYERINSFRPTGIDLLPEDKFPNLTGWICRMKNIPAVQKTLFDDESHLAYFKSYVKGDPDFDHGL